MSHSSALAFVLMCATGTASAGILVAKDGFAPGTNSNSIAASTSGQGWGSGWQTDVKNKPLNTVRIATPAGSATGGMLEFAGNHDKAAYRSFADKQQESLLVEFRFEFSGSLANNSFMGLWFGDSDGPSIGLKANCGSGTEKVGKNTVPCSKDLFVRMGGVDGVFLPGSDVVAGTSYHLFAHLYKDGGSKTFNRFDAWLNPTAFEMQSLTGWDARANSSAGDAEKLKNIGTIGFRTVNLGAGTTVRVDDLKVSKVPEPGSLSLMALALAGFAAVRRRRQG